jgi:CshA-type fibril repeat protein
MNQSVTATYTPTVNPPSGPTAVDDASSGALNQKQTEDVLADDFSNSGSPLNSNTLKLYDPNSQTYVTTPVSLANGTYTIAGGKIEFMPNQNFTGTAAPITYQIADSLGLTGTATYTPTVVGVPTAVNDVTSGPFNAVQSRSVLDNDSSADQNRLASSLLEICTGTSPSLTCSSNSVTVPEGVYSVNTTNGTISFTPVTGFIGVATPITYRITDSLGQSATATYTPTVNPPVAPVANPDTTSGWIGIAQGIDLLTNDTNDASTQLDRTSTRLCSPADSQPTPDTVVTPEVTPNCVSTSVIINGVGKYELTNGVMKFTPESDYFGKPEPLTYVVSDLNGLAASSTYTPEVLMPTKPLAVPDTSVGPFNQSQFEFIIVNDRAGEGTSLDPTYLMIYDPISAKWGTSDVTTVDGTYSIEPAQGLNMRIASLLNFPLSGDQSQQILAAETNFVGNLHKIVFTPVNGFTGTAKPIDYQIADMLGQKAQTTYTPTIETSNLISILKKLPKTGSGEFTNEIRLMLVFAVIGTGFLIRARRLRRINQEIA